MIDFLRERAKNMTEQAELRLKDRNPDTHLIGRMRTNARFYADAAEIVAAAPAGPVSITDDQQQRAELDKPAPRVTAKVSANGKRIGRPPKMTAKQILEASQGRAEVSRPEADTPENVLAHATAQRESVKPPPEYAGG